MPYFLTTYIEFDTNSHLSNGLYDRRDDSNVIIL